MVGHRDGPTNCSCVIRVITTDMRKVSDAFKAMFGAVYAANERRKTRETQNYPTFETDSSSLVGEAIAASARVGQWVSVQQ